jgi:hypothetical protein
VAVNSTDGGHETDLFISYTKHDLAWAEWIGFQLEMAGYLCVLQRWDFRPGSNFLLEIQEATSRSLRTIAVFSQAYLSATFTYPEWAAALARDPLGANLGQSNLRSRPLEVRDVHR